MRSGRRHWSLHSRDQGSGNLEIGVDPERGHRGEDQQMDQG